MSTEEISPIRETFAGEGPAQRSGAGASPANTAANIPLSPIPPEAEDEDRSSPTDAASIPDGQEGASPQSPDPLPFGGGPSPLGGRRSRAAKRLVSPQEAAAATRKLTPEQKLLILDTWQRSGLGGNDFGSIVGLSNQTLYSWKHRFEQLGPAGLVEDAKRKPVAGSKLPELTKRTILMLKKANPDWGCQRISDVLYRGPGLPASAASVAKVLKEAGYVTEELPTARHPDHIRSFERAAPNQLWQTDLFTFILKRQNRRLYLVAFMDDHSRFITGYGLHASQSAALVLEVFRAAVTSCGSPQEVLTDNGAQYVTWRGTSAFARELQTRGIKHIIASPHRPSTLGKIERFWGSLWRECLEAAIFLDLEDARQRIGHFIDHYNFQRPHQGLEGLTPADRFFHAAPQVLSTLKARVDAHALELARAGLPKEPFYLTGQVGGRPFSVHAEGERVYMLGQDGGRKEIDLTPPAPPSPQMPAPVCAQGIVNSDLADETEPPPGVSPLDEGLKKLTEGLAAPPATTIMDNTRSAQDTTGGAP
jgi:transposase InsO family protein